MDNAGARGAHTSPGSTRVSPGRWQWTLHPRSFSTSMSRSASRIERLRVSSQRCRSTRLSACAGAGCAAGSVFSCHPSSSNTTCRLSGTPWRNRSNASDRRVVKCSTAGAGSPGNPVRAQNALRTGSHCARGRKNASTRPTCFAPSMARVPVWISSCTVRNNALAQRRRSVSPVWRMSGGSAVGAKSSGAGGTPRRPAARCARESRPADSVGDTPSAGSSTHVIRLRNGAAVCSTRAWRAPRVQFARADWSSRPCVSGTMDSTLVRTAASPMSGSSSPAPRRWSRCTIRSTAWRGAVRRSSRWSSTRVRWRSRSVPYMSTAWASVSRHAWCRKHPRARWRRGAAISRIRAADAMRPRWNRIR